MIKSLLKFSLLVYITGSNFASVIKAQEVTTEKQSIGKRSVAWVRANPGKTAAIAAMTAAIIGGGIYGGHRLYKSSNEKRLHAEGVAYVPGFAEFEESDFYRNLSMKDKEKLIKENINFSQYANNFSNAKGLPSLYLVNKVEKTKETYRKFVLKNFLKNLSFLSFN